MSEAVKVQLNTVFLGIVASLMLAGVPWTYLINGRLTMIETKLEILLDTTDEVGALEIRLANCETDIAVLQNKGD